MSNVPEPMADAEVDAVIDAYLAANPGAVAKAVFETLRRVDRLSQPKDPAP